MMSVSLHESAAVFGPQPPLGEDESMLTPVCSDPVVQGRSRVADRAPDSVRYATQLNRARQDEV